MPRSFHFYQVNKYSILAMTILGMASCKSRQQETASTDTTGLTVKPLYISDSVRYDSDDPAIWINREDPSQSMILGTDKGGDTGDGALFVFDLHGKEIREKRVSNIRRPNNVDVGYDLPFGGGTIDIAVCTERNTNSIRVFRLPGMEPIDGNGIAVFENDSMRLPMGVALYSDPINKNMYAIVGRKTGPTDGSYLWQYLLKDDGKGTVKGTLVRKFGNYSGKNEIESIAVDNELGFVYCSDEGVGIRKYYAHPDSSNRELALFGTSGFTDNHEGISIYKFDDGTGYILVSDQQANQFHVFPREGTTAGTHEHPELYVFKTSTSESDGSEVTSVGLPGFPNGIFVAMSDDRTFQFYRWEDIAPKTLTTSKNGN